MSAASAVQAGRRAAESLMTETVEVGEYEDGGDPVTLEPTLTLVVLHYAGPGRIKYPSLAVSERVSGSQQVASVDVVLKVPVGAGGIREGDRVRVTVSTVDGSLVGRWFRVKAWPQSGAVTAHRYPIEELS